MSRATLPRRLYALVLASLAFSFGLATLARGGAAQTTPRGGPATVVLWHAYGESEARGLTRAVEAFERANPGVHVDVTAIPFGAYASKLQAAIPVGNGPDVFVDAHDRLASYVQDALIAPIGPRASALDAELTRELDGRLLDALSWEGELYGWPLAVKSVALYVNTDLGSADELAHLEDFERAAESAPEGMFALAWEVDSTYASAALFHAYGARAIDAEGHYTLASEPGAAALARLHTLVEAGVVPSETSGDLVRNLFRSGRALAAVSGPWLAPDLPAELHFEVRPLPVVHGLGDAPMVPYSTVESAFVSARLSEAGSGDNDARRSAIRRLASFLAGPDGARIRAREGGHIVAARTPWEDGSLADRPRLRAFRDAALAALPMPTHPHMSHVFGPTDRAIRKVLRGEMEPAAALAEAAHRFADETRPPPARRDPMLGIALLSSLLVLLVAALARQLMQPDTRAAVARSLPAYAWVTHAFVAVIVLVVLPLLVGAGTSFFAGSGAELHYVGAANYVDILTARGGDLLGHGSFYAVLGVTVLWTLVNVFFHVAIGIVLALALSRPVLRMKALYRVLLILPWAVPSYVTALAWRGMFHRQLGAVNAILALVGVEPVSWFAHFSTAFTANVATNVWLGFPFMMVVTLGALTSIPKDLYEAAEVDGATPFEQFRHITLPMLAPALLPAVAMGAVWTFNMFNVVFLVSAGEPDGTTEILVSEAYRWAFTRGHQTGYAAAYAVLIFGILSVFTRLLPGSKPQKAGGAK